MKRNRMIVNNSININKSNTSHLTDQEKLSLENRSVYSCFSIWITHMYIATSPRVISPYTPRKGSVRTIILWWRLCILLLFNVYYSDVSYLPYDVVL